MYNMYAFQLTIPFTIVRLLLIYTYVRNDFQMVVLHEAVSFLLFYYEFFSLLPSAFLSFKYAAGCKQLQQPAEEGGRMQLLFITKE